MPELGPTRVSSPGLWGWGRIDGYPISGDISSPYGPREPFWTPYGWTSNFHSGIDIPAPAGTPIFAPCGMRIVSQVTDVVFGNTVVGTTDDGYAVSFLHMLEGSPMIGVGNRVERGGIVGLVGTTGMSTGNHLHFQVAKDGRTFDPMQFFVEVLANTEVLPEPETELPPALLDFISNSIAALALNPPADMKAALIELQRRVEYLKDLMAT